MGGCNGGIDISVSERVKCGDENIEVDYNTNSL